MKETKRKLMKSLAALLIALMLALCACAEVVKPSNDFYYLDGANVLSEATEGEIFFSNERLQKACGAEIVVVAIPTTGRMSIEDYAYTLFNDWDIGGESYRGFLLLMAIDDDDYFALPGTYLSSYFDTATIQDLNDTYLEPNFAAKDYDGGAKRYFEAVFGRVCDVLNLNLTVEMGIADYKAFVLENQSQGGTVSDFGSAEQRRPVSRGGVSIDAILLILLLVVLLIGAVRRFHRRPGGRYSAPPPPPSGGRGSFASGYILGRMFRPRPYRRPPPPPGPGGFWGSGPRMGNPGPGPDRRGSRPGGSSVNPGSFGGSARPSGGAAPRSSGFGGASRGSAPRTGGFGGASRSGGVSRGPSTRGGGAGRGRR